MELCKRKTGASHWGVSRIKVSELRVNLAYWNRGNGNLALTVTSIRWITQAVWNLLGFKSSFFNHHFVSVVGFWYHHYLAFNCGFKFFYYWWRRICLSERQLGNWLFTMSMWDLTSDNGHTMAHEHVETPEERAMCWPYAYLLFTL